ncbi:uncharacterized protein LOC109727503 [Ananas comosus]|uniref:Uncharacterized protein LOC109727503 n=1 Tax=Ananas comosus TaxID=4615 RepID=A0A6P5GZH4_ANACO|nr:uncharacterized protein LOC109727503 [Ananas comosus]
MELQIKTSITKKKKRKKKKRENKRGSYPSSPLTRPPETLEWPSLSSSSSDVASSLHRPHRNASASTSSLPPLSSPSPSSSSAWCGGYLFVEIYAVGASTIPYFLRFSTASPWRRRRPPSPCAPPPPPPQRPHGRRSRGGGGGGGAAEEQVRVRRRTLEAVLEQCQRTLEMLKNADLEPDPDAGDEIGSKGSAGEEEEEEEKEEEVRLRTPSSVDYETDEFVRDREIFLGKKAITLLMQRTLLVSGRRFRRRRRHGALRHERLDFGQYIISRMIKGEEIA